MIPNGTPCPDVACGGRLQDGYCNVCGMAPKARPAPPPGQTGRAGQATNPTYQLGARQVAAAGGHRRSARLPMLRPASRPTRSAGTAPHPALRTESTSTRSSRRTGSTRLGLGLVELPPVPTGDPAEAVMALAEVPERKRYCSTCNKAVGRSRQGRPGRTEGFCAQCGNRFSFTPKLHPGQLVSGQYEVLGAVAHGGMGWIYLAQDKAVSDRWVVLKGLLDTSSDDLALAAVAEQRFLAALDHPNIVEIYNFVTHEGAGYIVMEYVAGKSLKTVLKERQEANKGKYDPLPMDQAIAYVLGILPALGYLHAAGLVYCDMKPDNVVLSGDSLKIIDLGGVRRIDDEDAAIYGTAGYQAPEVADMGPTPASDLYTVGRTLAVLVFEFRGYQSSYSDSLPHPDDQPLLVAEESLHRFLLKATAADPSDRFGTAEEMAEQLLGVLREEVAEHGSPHPAASSVFGPDVATTGIAAGHEGLQPDWRLLPRPRVDPLDPAAGLLASLPAGDPVVTVQALTAAVNNQATPLSFETVLRLARAHLEAGSPDHAANTLDNLGEARDWRLWWHRGLVAMARGNPTEAIDWLDPVYTDLPGEVAPKLALGLAHELAGDRSRAAELYDRASRSDPSYVSGAFGLARVRLALGDREGAFAALSRVSAASSAYTEARVAAVRALASRVEVGVPSPTQLERASRVLDGLDLDPRRRALLDLELFESGLFVVAALASNPGPIGGASVLGRPLTDAALRGGLEDAYRQLARHATTTRERINLIDSANRVRPRTLI